MEPLIGIETFKVLIQQTPALAALIWIVAHFLKAMAERDKNFLESYRDINKELRLVSAAIRDLVKVTSSLHSKFSVRMDRIERKAEESEEG